VVFNFNLDGLARRYLNGCHLVLEPHGSVDRLWTRDEGFSERLEWSLDIRLPSIRRKVLPGPEPPLIANTRPYLDARPHLRSARSVIILGYSFGTFEGYMDDIRSFDYLIENQLEAQSSIFVVSPDPESTAARIEARLRSKRVRPVVLYWDIFSNVLNTLMGEHGRVSDFLPDNQFDYLLALYCRALDSHGRSSR
jgi:hypothetical protein